MMKEYRFDQIAIVSTEKKKPTEEDRANYVGLEHLSPDTFDVTEYGSEVAPKGEKLVMRKGDVLFGKRRAYQKKVGIAPCDGIFSAHGMVLRPNEDVVDSRFFPFFIKSDCFLDEAIRISVGSLSPTVNWRDLRELRFRLPSLERQHELAELLWAGEELKSTYRQLLFACDEQVKSRFVEMFGIGTTMTPYRPLGEIAEVTSGITKGRRVPVGPLHEVPYMAVANVKDGFLDTSTLKTIQVSSDEIQRFRLLPGDVLMTEGGDPDKLGRGAMVRHLPDNCIHQNHVFRVRADRTLVSPQYLELYLRQDVAKDYFLSCAKQTTGIASVNKTQVRALPVLMPNEDAVVEYTSFAEQVDKSEYL